jgi:hypothetical protein
VGCRRDGVRVAPGCCAGGPARSGVVDGHTVERCFVHDVGTTVGVVFGPPDIDVPAADGLVGRDDVIHDVIHDAAIAPVPGGRRR